MKPFWKSKTIGINLFVIVIVQGLARFYPGFREAMCGNTEFILSSLALMNMALRRLTKVPITALVLLLSLSSCSSMQQMLDPKLFYKRDIEIKVNNKTYEGVTVVPHASTYDIGLKPKGDIDLLLLRTCHREFSGEKLSAGGIFVPGKEFHYQYTPVQGIEDSRVCPMRVDAYESKNGRNSWAFLDFESPEYTVQATLDCNGETIKINGVGACQAKEQTVQRIRFSEPIRFAPVLPERCKNPKKSGDWYEITASIGECLYLFDTESGSIGRLTLIGYGGVLVREGQ